MFGLASWAASGVAVADNVCSRRNATEGRIIAVPCNERLAGDWSGLLTETDGKAYRVEISLSKEGSGTISYGLGCSGSLAYKGRQGSRYVYRETIKEGADKCTDGGEVTLTSVVAEGTTLDFDWNGDSLTTKGRVAGVMTAGITEGSNTSSSPASDGKDTCARYLPNRENWVPMPCGGRDDD